MNAQQKYAKSEKRKLYLVEYREKNKERLFAYQKEWVRQNKEKVRTNAARWTKNNPEKNALKSSRRRAKIKQRETFLITDKELNRLYNNPCSHCGATEDITLDHIIPVSRGGRHSIGNLQSLCLSCNSSKNSRTIMEWKVNKRIPRSKGKQWHTSQE